MSNPLVSVVVCHHTGKLILNAVSTILESKFIAPQVIISSSQKDIVIHGVDRILHDTRLPASKRNDGIKFAMSKYVAFFDDDVKVGKYTIYEMLKVLQDESIGMVFGKLLNMEHRTRFDEAGGFLTWTGFIWARAESGIEDNGQYDKTEPIFAGKSAACMVRRDVFWKAGGFDESFGILGEESDLAWRIWNQGYKVMYAPKSVTYHAFNTRFKPVDQFYTAERIYFNGCRNYLRMLLKNAPIRMLVLALPLQVGAWTIAGIGHFFHGRWKAGQMIFRALGSICLKLDLILKQRSEVQKQSKLKWKELQPIIVRNPPLKYYLDRMRSYIVRGTHG